jgi:hypothetical protein
VIVDLLTWLLTAAALIGATLLIAESLRTPPRLICKCGAPGFQRPHLKRPWLLVAGTMYGLAGMNDLFKFIRETDPMSRGFWGLFGVMFVLVSVIYLRRWRRHPKDKNRHPLGRILAVVRETAAGLRIVPTPAGSRA